MAFPEQGYTAGGAVGHIWSQEGDSFRISVLESLLTHPTHADNLVDKGDTVRCGSIVGVAMDSAAAATDYVPVLTRCGANVNVVASDDAGTSAVAFGDLLYIGTDGVVSKKASGVPFGVALAAASASASATSLPVLVGVFAEGLRGLADVSETLSSAAPALSTVGVSLIDSSENAVDGTLADGAVDGQLKLIIMTDASNSSTITIASHETSDPEVATFDAVGEMLLLIWAGSQWNTVKSSATFV
jgi:hypothetical protein